MAVTLQNILEDLNYLMGDTSVPSTGIENQYRFINRAIQDIWDRHDWSWANAATDYVFSGTSQTLPTIFDGRLLEVREVQAGQSGNDILYGIGDYSDRDLTSSEHLAWVDGNDVDGFTLNINQSDNPTLKVTFKRTADTLTNTSDATRIPRSMPIALGALVRMYQAEDPYRDVTQERADFERSVGDLVRMATRNEPRRKFFVASPTRRIGEPR